MSSAPMAGGWLQILPPAVLTLVQPDAALEARMSVAKGLAPLPLQSLIFGLSALCDDASAELAQVARGTLTKMPEHLLLPVLRGDTPGLVLAALLPAIQTRPALMEAAVANRNTPDAALCAHAPTASGAIAEMLAQDQQRCLRCEALVLGLSRNSQLLKSSWDKLIDFLVRAGVMVDVPATAETMDRLTPAEMQSAAAHIALPDAAQALLVETVEASAAELAQIQEAQNDAAAPRPSSADDTVFDHAADNDVDVEGAVDNTAAQARVPMLKLVNGLNMAQKIALATKGNKEARSILLRDANRIVAVAAIKNPRITDQEVQAAAKSRSINDEVIRIIAHSKEMTRSYGTKLSLVNNPKTPLGIALRLLPVLRAVDLKAIAKSKGLPQALIGQAKKLLVSKDAG